MHFCMDEVYQFMMALPILSYGVYWLRSKFGHSTCNHKHEGEDAHS